MSRAEMSGAEMSVPSAAGSLPWLVPPAYDASAASLTAHVEAVGEVMAGRARLWLGPFAAPSHLPAGFEDTSLVVPTSTDPQEGASARWAHKLSIQPDGQRQSWVVCNHLYTVSNARLEPLQGAVIPRLSETEFNQILALIHAWLPKAPEAAG